MFVGRKRELAALEQHFDTGRFEMAVVYGRRRVGKTALLVEFARARPCLFFTAQEKSDEINLSSFSRAAASFFGEPAGVRFDDWPAALSFVAAHVRLASGPILLVFDEFPYAAKAQPSLPSMLQIAIDHEFAGANATLVLCGSNQGFMEDEVLSEKSPLYGRRTMQMRLRPFDLFDAARLLPACSAEEKVHYYATFGGTPYYLSQIDHAQGYGQNVERLLFDPYGVLYAEPSMLLRQELRDVALYQSVLDAVASGATRPKAIAERAGVDQNSIGKYLVTLESLGLVRRDVPFGAPIGSRRGLYSVADPFFAYWYRFVSPHSGAIEQGAGRAVFAQVAQGQALETHTGRWFEEMCLQWVVRRNATGSLGFLASRFGRWWGSDPRTRTTTDVDLVASSSDGRQMLVGECKWRNSFDETKALAELSRRCSLFAPPAKMTLALFSKRPASTMTAEKAARDGDVLLVDAPAMLSEFG